MRRLEKFVDRTRKFVVEMLSAEHPIRAAFADALLVLLGNLAIWDTVIDFARMQGRNLDGLQYDAVGAGIFLGAVMTLPFSAAALITARFIQVRREPSLQPKIRITLTIMAKARFHKRSSCVGGAFSMPSR